MFDVQSVCGSGQVKFHISAAAGRGEGPKPENQNISKEDTDV
jgi:hypothetical protein